ncbi:hypothetical protein [Paenibacillus agaridevorans]|uniref:hypothetical protein n=1 Tax=Paenibacillus agaridevorans TaxID=171404 RepID=UPI001BE4613F|nr:hypothetical protein [Paenibacillus agaridevorans]
MEKENPQVALTEDEFMSLVSQAQNQDPDAMLKDALQHMRLALIELFQEALPC